MPEWFVVSPPEAEQPGRTLKKPEQKDPRTKEGNLKKCPHGNLITEGCAICDPERWKLLGGAE